MIEVEAYIEDEDGGDIMVVADVWPGERGQLTPVDGQMTPNFSQEIRKIRFYHWETGNPLMQEFEPSPAMLEEGREAIMRNI